MSDDTLKALAPAANRTPRRLFYWISLLVVISIALQTALEGLDVHLFPRRSWSEGNDAKVIQAGDTKVYYKYIDVRPSDLRLQLPPGVQPIFLGVMADVHPRNTAAKLLLRALTIPDDLFLLALVWMVR